MFRCSIAFLVCAVLFKQGKQQHRAYSHSARTSKQAIRQTCSRIRKRFLVALSKERSSAVQSADRSLNVFRRSVAEGLRGLETSHTYSLHPFHWIDKRINHDDGLAWHLVNSSFYCRGKLALSQSLSPLLLFVAPSSSNVDTPQSCHHAACFLDAPPSSFACSPRNLILNLAHQPQLSELNTCRLGPSTKLFPLHLFAIPSRHPYKLGVSHVSLPILYLYCMCNGELLQHAFAAGLESPKIDSPAIQLRSISNQERV